jgi:hypothetical protein
MVMVIPDAALEPGQAACRFDAPDQARGGERVECLIHGLKGDMAHAVTYAGGDRIHAEMVTIPDRLEQRDACGRHSKAGSAQLLGGGGWLGGGHGPNLPP